MYKSLCLKLKLNFIMHIATETTVDVTSEVTET